MATRDVTLTTSEVWEMWWGLNVASQKAADKRHTASAARYAASAERWGALYDEMRDEDMAAKEVAS